MAGNPDVDNRVGYQRKSFVTKPEVVGSQTRSIEMKLYRLVSAIVMIVGFIGFTACVGMVVTDAVASKVEPLIQPERVIGGEKASCVDACTTFSNSNGACDTARACSAPGGNIIQCGPTTLNTECGEIRTGKQVKLACKADPCGAKDPCVNDGAATRCGTYTLCTCKFQGGNHVCTVKPNPNPSQDCMSVNPSSNCP
jgi:hypothetical protein